VESNAPATLRIEAYSSAANWSFAEVAVSNDIPAGGHVDYFVLFSTGFTNVGTGANFSSVVAFRVLITSHATDSILRLDVLEASTKRDFGDQLATYGEVSHSSSPFGARLGVNKDTEEAQNYSALANGDDTDQADDEDGVERTPDTPWIIDPAGGSIIADVRFCPDTCAFVGWIDWNGNGNFNDIGEKVIEADVTSGAQLITFEITQSVTGFYKTRFRLFEEPLSAFPPAGPLSYGDGVGGGNGTYAVGGEVEDYYWEFGPNAIQLTTLEAQSGGLDSAGWTLVIALGVCVPLLGLVLYLRRRQAR
jgi:hypothetical protein